MRRVSVRRIWAARAVAVIADLVQLGFLPFFAPGVVSPWNDGLEALTAATLIALIGWSWALVPAFFTELVPGVDLFPTWTTAVLFAKRRFVIVAVAPIANTVVLVTTMAVFRIMHGPTPDLDLSHLEPGTGLR